MLATLTQNASPLSHSTKATHILVILPKLDKSPDKFPDKSDFSGRGVLETLLSRRKMKLDEIGEAPVSANLKSGALCAWVMVDLGKSRYEQQTCVRKAVQLLLEENPTEIDLAVYGDTDQKRAFAELAVYAVWVNGALLPSRKTSKKKPGRKALTGIVLHGHK
ncbi:MAG: leucyl aminopeptidase family protein, partial [Pseudomonadota bacterium]